MAPPQESSFRNLPPLPTLVGTPAHDADLAAAQLEAEDADGDGDPGANGGSRREEAAEMGKPTVAEKRREALLQDLRNPQH